MRRKAIRLYSRVRDKNYKVRELKFTEVFNHCCRSVMMYPDRTVGELEEYVLNQLYEEPKWEEIEVFNED